MAIKHGSKVQSAINASSMTDLMFLLLVFLLISTTMVTPNALKLVLPRSTTQVTEKAYTTVSITRDMTYAVDGEVVPFSRLEEKLREKVGAVEDPVVSLHADEAVDWGEVVKVMNILKNNNYKMIAATRPE
jgi:biopolymer transport protein ExbD